jgi:hypothetical protein
MKKKNTGSSKKGEGEKDRLTFSDWDPGIMRGWGNPAVGQNDNRTAVYIVRAAPCMDSGAMRQWDSRAAGLCMRQWGCETMRQGDNEVSRQ